MTKEVVAVATAPGDARRWQLLKLKELQKGLMGRQMTGVLHAQDLRNLMSDNPHVWKDGESPELHVSIIGTKSPVAVTVSDDCYLWRRSDGEEMACPVSLFSKALEMIIYTVNVS
jgi:hypothetical protein